MEILTIIALVISFCWAAFSVYVMLAVLKIQVANEAILALLKQEAFKRDNQAIIASAVLTTPPVSTPSTFVAPF